MSSKIVFNLSGVGNESEGYLAGIRITDEDGKEISYDASGETPEELYTNILLNGITTILDSKISEENTFEDEVPCSCDCDCAHCGEDSVDTDEMLLDYALMLEEENEQLRDEVQFLRNRLDKADELIAEFPQVCEIAQELLNDKDQLIEENDTLYAYIHILEQYVEMLEDKIENFEEEEDDEIPTLTVHHFYLDENGNLIEEIETEWLLS